MTTTNLNPYRRSLLRRERSLDTRRKLVRAAARLWSEQGYDTTTVEEICSAAGVGRTTYYLHFESKEQLLLELTLATARGVADDVEKAVAAGTLNEQLTTFTDGLVRRMESVPKSLAALTMRQAVSGATRPDPVPADIILFDDILTEIVLAAQGRGEIRADVDGREIGDVLGGTTMDALQRWVSGRSRQNLRDSLQLRIELVVDGLRIPPTPSDQGLAKRRPRRAQRPAP